MPTSLMALPPQREVVLVAYDGARLINIAAVLDLFALANDVTGKSAAFRYNTRIVTRAGGPLPTASGVTLLTDSFADVSNLKIDTLLLAGGPGAYAASKDAVLVGWIRERAAATRRTCSTCTGTYLLAAAGLLRGRTATTHWQDAHQLQALHPDVRADGNLIYSRDGKIWTSAGATAALDLCLALIQEDCGFEVAMQVAKISVVYVRRSGGQLQFSTALLAQAASDENFSALHAWMREHLNDDLTIDVLAERALMSVRNFQRVYKATMSRTVTKTLLAMRLEAAQRALETGGLRLKSVARACGFRDVKGLRRAFVRQFGVSPADYRDRFSQTSNESARPSVRGERPAPTRSRALGIH